MSVEPTEEQLQKGEQMYGSSDYMTSRDFAEILAEREAVLREQVATLKADLETALMFVESGKDLIATLTVERDAAIDNRDAHYSARYAAEADVERLTKEVERADEQADGFASKCIRLQDNNAAHRATIKPAAWMCSGCGALSRHQDAWSSCVRGCVNAGADSPLFTRADLVAVGDKMRAAFILSLDDVVLASVLHAVADDTPDAMGLVADLLGEQKGGG